MKQISKALLLLLNFLFATALVSQPTLAEPSSSGVTSSTGTVPNGQQPPEDWEVDLTDLFKDLYVSSRERLYNHLILGDGDFSFTRALLRKHSIGGTGKEYKDLARHIVATEYNLHKDLFLKYPNYGDNVGNRAALLGRGLVVVNATDAGERDQPNVTSSKRKPGDLSFAQQLQDAVGDGHGVLATGVDVTKLDILFRGIRFLP